MGAEIAEVSGRVLTLEVSGPLTQLELKGAQAAAVAIQYFGPGHLATAGAWPDVE